MNDLKLQNQHADKGAQENYEAALALAKELEDKKVVVIGGGNVAMDTSRTIKRLGAKEVKIVYRRSEKQMPAERKEIEEAKKEFLNGCFAPNWLEVDLNETQAHTVKEERLESKRRKDLNTLLKELDEIKQNIERAAEKQHRLANLMSFYTGEFAQ